MTHESVSLVSKRFQAPGRSRRHTRSFSIAKMAVVMRPADMQETFSELAVKDPDLIRLVLQMSVAALANVQSVEAADTELKHRAVTGN